MHATRMNMYSAGNTAQALRPRHVDVPASGTEHASFARWFWLAEARASLRVAKYWKARFGGPLHESALLWHLEAVAGAQRFRVWAREMGSR